MTLRRLSNRKITAADRCHEERVIRANEAFVLRMRAAAGAGLEKVSFGVSVDTTPPISAVRPRVTVPRSFVGSPGALCAIT